MNRSRRRILGLSMLVWVVCSCAFPLSVWAAGSAKLSLSGNISTMYWNDRGDVHMAINNRQSDSYILIHEGTPYMVINSGAEPVAMNLQTSFDVAAKESDASGMQVVSFKATGKHETVAGIRGSVYAMILQDADGKKQSHEVVLASDSRAQELSKAFLSMARSFTEATSRNEVMRHLPQNKGGMLRVDDTFKVLSISDKKPETSRFELPSKVTDTSTMVHDQINQAVEEEKQERNDQMKRNIQRQIRNDVRHGIRRNHRRMFR